MTPIASLDVLRIEPDGDPIAGEEMAMGVMTQLRLMVLGASVALVALTLGPLLGLAWLLELRDRRQSGLRDAVLGSRQVR